VLIFKVDKVPETYVLVYDRWYCSSMISIDPLGLIVGKSIVCSHSIASLPFAVPSLISVGEELCEK
jgi:hypothetical protein